MAKSKVVLKVVRKVIMLEVDTELSNKTIVQELRYLVEQFAPTNEFGQLTIDIKKVTVSAK